MKMNTRSYLYYKRLLWHCCLVTVNKQAHGYERAGFRVDLFLCPLRLCKLDEEMCTVSGSG